MTKSKGESKEIATWKTGLAEAAQKVVEEEKPTGVMITPKHCMFWQGDTKIGETLDVIILEAMSERCLYLGKYDPNNKDAPNCFAQSFESKQLAPHENVPTNSLDELPLAPGCDELKTCADCNWSKPGTADYGKGSKCKLYKKLAVVSIDALQKGATDADMVPLKVSPTSVQNYSKYASALARGGLPPWCYMTRVTIKPDNVTQWKIDFEVLKKIEDDGALNEIYARLNEAQRKLMQPYTYDDGGSPKGMDNGKAKY